MKRTNFKITGGICLFALLFSLSSAIGGKRFATARYKMTGSATCFMPETLPQGCITTNSGTLCTQTTGSITKTYYQDACVTPYYRIAE
jgi:hypothetical protein